MSEKKEMEIEQGKTFTKRYTVGEEVFNSVTHGVGAALSIAALVLMIVVSVKNNSGLALANSLVYGISLIVLYTMSTVYHAVSSPRAKEVFRVFDHASVFILIAGSYTPFCLIGLQGDYRGIVVVAVVWACAIGGIVMNAINLEKTEKLGTVLYVIMGWAIIVVILPITRALEAPAFWMLLIGGIAYTAGLIFFAMKHKFFHSIWHLFVLAGSILHFFSIFFYVLPMAY